MKKNDKPLIGFIGQGWIGKHYADNFVERGYKVERYDVTPKYKKNKNKVKKCDIVFVAVPTPSTPNGFDDSILINAIKSATTKGQIIVIKSTIMVGTTDKLQKMFKDRYLIHSPEFLTEKTAKYDTDYPDRNIIGYTKKSKKYAEKVMSVLPYAARDFTVPVKEAELVKYAGNIWFFMKVMFVNTVNDISEFNGLDYEMIKKMMKGDSRIGGTHLDVSHQGGRGAGGHCFIKDMSAYREMYSRDLRGEEYNAGAFFLYAAEKYNQYLLKHTNKDIDLYEGVYGKD